MKKTMQSIAVILFSIILFSSCDDTSYHQGEVMVTEAVQSSSQTTMDEVYEEEARNIIKSASIALEVDHLEKSILNLKSFLQPINGYVYNYEITNSSYALDSYQKNMDSAVTVEQITPSSNLSVRVPIAYADSFINYILAADAQISLFKISDEDVTENLWEKKQVANVYEASGKSQKQKGNTQNIGFDNNASIEAIRAKAAAAKLNFQTKYLWFDINMQAQPFIKTKTSIATKNYRTPMHIGLAQAIVTGWHICEDIVLGLITIWPLFILVGLVIVMVRRYRLAMAKH